MKSADEILREVAGLAPRERAAAIAHYIYMKTAEQTGWGKRVPITWGELPLEAREFNMASVQTWIRETELLENWLAAVRAVEQEK